MSQDLSIYRLCRIVQALTDRPRTVGLDFYFAARITT